MGSDEELYTRFNKAFQSTTQTDTNIQAYN